MAEPYFKIFDADGNLKDTVPYVEDCPNNGLPDWFFTGCYFDLYIDEDQNQVEWVPGVGPNPCWKEILSKFVDDADMFVQFKQWVENNY